MGLSELSDVLEIVNDNLSPAKTPPAYACEGCTHVTTNHEG